MNALDLVRLPALMALTIGRPEVRIALNGPVATSHPGLSETRIENASPGSWASCTRIASAACRHGTLVAGMLCGRRDSAAPSICPGCTLLVRPVFSEQDAEQGQMAGATCDELSRAILESIVEKVTIERNWLTISSRRLNVVLPSVA